MPFLEHRLPIFQKQLKGKKTAICNHEPRGCRLLLDAFDRPGKVVRLDLAGSDVPPQRPKRRLPAQTLQLGPGPPWAACGSAQCEESWLARA